MTLYLSVMGIPQWDFTGWVHIHWTVGHFAPNRNAATWPWFWILPSVTRPDKVPDLRKPCVRRLGFILLSTEDRGFGTLYSAIY